MTGRWSYLDLADFLVIAEATLGVSTDDLIRVTQYRSGLVPRGMAMLGLIGAPLIIPSGTAVVFDVFEPGSGPQVIATVPGILLGVVAWHLPHRQGFNPEGCQNADSAFVQGPRRRLDIATPPTP